jgi:hypothetical protein
MESRQGWLALRAAVWDETSGHDTVVIAADQHQCNATRPEAPGILGCGVGPMASRFSHDLCDSANPDFDFEAVNFHIPFKKVYDSVLIGRGQSVSGICLLGISSKLHPLRESNSPWHFNTSARIGES